MHLLVNDLSFHGQLLGSHDFRAAIVELMSARAVARQYGRELYCHRGLGERPVANTIPLRQAAQQWLSRDEKASLLSWIQRHGPFWEDVRVHNESEWFEWQNELVTDSAVAEAAWCCLQENNRSLFSVVPSRWAFTPVSVRWVSDQASKDVTVDNYWTCSALRLDLERSQPPIRSWPELAAVAQKFEQLIFFDKAFEPLDGHPFSPSAAERILLLLKTLDKMKSCFDPSGSRTSEGHELYQNFFTGKKGEGGRGAIFTDSSDPEKGQFRKELTFAHPADPNQTMFCPWHGKIQTPQFRVHFSYPISADRELYVVYVGPKITKA